MTATGHNFEHLQPYLGRALEMCIVELFWGENLASQQKEKRKENNKEATTQKKKPKTH